MRVSVRVFAFGLGFIASAAFAAQGGAPEVMPPAKVGRMHGYVMTHFYFAQPETDAETDCPGGMTMSLRDDFIAQLPPADRERASRVTELGKVARMILATDHPKNGLKLGEALTNKDMYGGHNVCDNPADYEYTQFKTIEHSGTAKGLNLDGTADGSATATTCAHKKFTNADGTPAIDNQMWRAFGCIKVYRHDGNNDWDSNIRTGEWTVLMEVSDPKGGGTDGDVDVAFYSGKDPVTLDANRHIPPGLSLSVSDDPRFRAVTHGHIANGVLTTDPVDFTFKYDNQIVHVPWVFDAVRFRLTMEPDGSLKGLMGGYANVDKFYNFVVMPQSIQGAVSNKIDCPGLYAALYRLADGERDPATGSCKALSVAFEVNAIPAFVIHPTDRQAALGGKQ